MPRLWVGVAEAVDTAVGVLRSSPLEGFPMRSRSEEGWELTPTREALN